MKCKGESHFPQENKAPIKTEVAASACGEVCQEQRLTEGRREKKKKNWFKNNKVNVLEKHSPKHTEANTIVSTRTVTHG